MLHPRKLTAKAPEKWWLEEDFPFEKTARVTKGGSLEQPESQQVSRNKNMTTNLKNKSEQHEQNAFKGTLSLICFATFLPNILNKHVMTRNDQIP